MSDLNFSDSGVDQVEAEAVEATEPEAAAEAVDAGEPMEIGEPAVDENVDLDAKDLAQAENEQEHEMDGFHIEEPEVKAEPEVEQEDPYRKFREELRSQPGKWYVVHSYAGYERRVKQNIEVRKASLAGGDEVFQVEVPMEETIEIKNGQRKLVTKIDSALQRIAEGEFGYCEVTGEPISLKRLDARPIATMSLEAQERHERKEKVHRDD